MAVRIILMLLAVIAGWACFSVHAHSMTSWSVLHEASARQRAELEWRYTTQGWKQLSISRPYTFQVPDDDQTLHPIAWLGLMLTLLGGSLTWASSEWERSQIWRSFTRRFQPRERETGGKAD